MVTTILSLLLIHGCAFAQVDSASQQGSEDTQTFLKTPEQREKFIKENKRAQEVDAKVDALAGSKENKEDIYDLAAQLMEKITTDAKGDPEKMQMMLLEAQKDPKAFYEKMFNESQKARVRGIAGEIEKKKPKSSGASK